MGRRLSRVGSLVSYGVEKCPNCGSRCGPKVYCTACDSEGCVDCIGMVQLGNECKQCGAREDSIHYSD